MKDYFSTASDKYAQFRPTYPIELYDFLLQLCTVREKAWDCGTGNGQVAGELANFFREVQATDISNNQLSQAVQKPNIHYTKQAAEKITFSDNYFDLVTVGQAVHWFDFDRFYAEAKRVLKKDAVIAIFGYSLFRTNPEADEILQNFYKNIIGPYWKPERKFLDEDYKTIPFPFKEISSPKFLLKQSWSFERLIGYLNTWSAVRSYEKERGENPVERIKKDLFDRYGELGPVEFPILLRAGRNPG